MSCYNFELGGGRQAHVFPEDMILCSWNCQGFNRSEAVHSLRVILNSHKPIVLLLSVIKISCSSKFASLMSSLRFEHYHFVLARVERGD